MPIRNIQISLREVGRIRCGDQVAHARGKAPRKLDRFRFTSDDAQLLDVVAGLYGGTVDQWTDGPGDQWQVYVSAERIPVMMVPGLRPITQWWEAWSGGGCLRRCDGEREMIAGTPCACINGERICKPTTRLHVVLPEIPGLGTWRLESHGYYAAVELGGTVELITRLATATGEPVYGTLRLTQRTQKIAGQPTRQFAVPTLDISVTVPDLAQRIAQAEGQDQRPLDARNAQRLQELAQGHDTGAGAFPGDADRAAAEQRSEDKLARKRTPGMGPGNRHRGTTVPSTVPLNEATEDGPPLEDYAPADVVKAFDSPISANQMKAIQTLFRMTGLDDRDERLLFSARIIERSINSSKDLTAREASQIMDVLWEVEQGTAEYVTDVNGRIIGAVPVDVLGHDDPLSDAEPLPDE